MRVSECRVKLWHQDPVRAIVSITLDDQFVVKGIRILSVHSRYIVCMPSRPGPDGRHRDVAHPINSATRERLNKEILDAYEEELERARTGAGASRSPDSDDLMDGDERPETGAWAR